MISDHPDDFEHASYRMVLPTEAFFSARDRH
jgi:hypothetical protein